RAAAHRNPLRRVEAVGEKTAVDGDPPSRAGESMRFAQASAGVVHPFEHLVDDDRVERAAGKLLAFALRRAPQLEVVATIEARECGYGHQSRGCRRGEDLEDTFPGQQTEVLEAPGPFGGQAGAAVGQDAGAAHTRRSSNRGARASSL